MRGDSFDRVAGFSLAPDGALAALLLALGRPVLRREMERQPELAGELQGMVAGGFVLAAPLAGPDGLEGVLLTDERGDGLEPQAHDFDLVAGLCDLVAGALRNARRYRSSLERSVELLASVAGDPATPALRAEAAGLVERVARVALLPPRTRGLLKHAVGLGAAAGEPRLREALARLATDDSTGWIAELAALAAAAPSSPEHAADPPSARAALLVAFARRLVIARAGGEMLGPATARAAESLGDALDAGTRQALEAAVRDLLALERSAA